MRSLVLTVTLACLMIAVCPTPVGADPDPCSGVTGGPPINDPGPTIAGTVTENVNSNPPIKGATMELFKCVSQVSVSQGTDTTDSNGDYGFHDLDEGNYFYVEAQMTGPLEGMSPAAGTSNPSDIVGLGPSVYDLDFEFED